MRGESENAVKYIAEKGYQSTRKELQSSHFVSIISSTSTAHYSYRKLNAVNCCSKALTSYVFRKRGRNSQYQVSSSFEEQGARWLLA